MGKRRAIVILSNMMPTPPKRKRCSSTPGTSTNSISNFSTGTTASSSIFRNDLFGILDSSSDVIDANNNIMTMVEDVQQIQNLINNEPSALEASTSDLIETPELDSETPEVDIPEDIVLNADSLIAQSLETLETARTLSVETDSDDNNIEDEFGSIIRKHKSLQKECKSMKKRITELEAEKNKLEEQLCNEIETSDRLKREKDIKTKEVEDLRRRSNEVNSLQEQVTILDRELRNFKDENRELKKQREGRISIISKLQTDIT